MRALLLAFAFIASPAGAQVANDTFRVFTVHTPPEVARTDTILGQAPDWAEQPPPGGIMARLVLMDDGLGGHHGCGPPANAAQIAGQIALIQRGGCEFMQKALSAEQAGATAFIVYQDDRVPDDDCGSILMGAGAIPESPEIPGGFLPRCVAVAILPTVESGAEVTATLAPFVVGVAAEPGPETEGLALSVAPNPVRGPAVITLTLTRSSPARVTVHDVLGRTAARLHEGPLPAGAHHLAFDTAALPPGVYVVRAETGGAAAATRWSLAR